jgi:hypothetical protein
MVSFRIWSIFHDEGYDPPKKEEKKNAFKKEQTVNV